MAKEQRGLLVPGEIDFFAVPSGTSIKDHADALHAAAEEMAQGKSDDRFTRIGKQMLVIANRSATEAKEPSNVIPLPARRSS